MTAHWNRSRSAETRPPLLSGDEDACVIAAQEALAGFAPAFEHVYYEGLRAKLGLATSHEEDPALAGAFLQAMRDNRVDFTLFFRRLSEAQSPGEGEEPLRSLFAEPTACDAILDRWRNRLALEPEAGMSRRDRMRAVNPAYIPRNHQVEAMIQAAVERDDFAPIHELLTVLARPFEDRAEFERYAEPPTPEQRVRATFCGT